MKEKEIEKILTENGASLVGFCDLGFSPLEDFKDFRYAVSIACKLSDSVLKTIDERPSITYFMHYRTTNARLDQLALDTVYFLEKNGYGAFPIAASQSDNTNGREAIRGVFQHKTAARLSGLGFIGKSGLFITKEYGSKVRFVTVLTNMPLKSTREIINGGCGDCEVCKNACPGGAISGKNYHEGMKRDDFFSAEKCSFNMKKYNDVGRGAVCGICIRVCPYNNLGSRKCEIKN